MQSDHVLEKLNVDLLTPSPASGWLGLGGGGGGGGYRQNICYHAAAFRDFL